MGSYKWGYKQGNYILMNHTRGRITPLRTTHEPPRDPIQLGIRRLVPQRSFEEGSPRVYGLIRGFGIAEERKSMDQAPGTNSVTLKRS